MSKLLYNLHSLCLTEAETRRLDAFHVRGLRNVMRIPPSYYSRVSNAVVLERANAKTASNVLLERQLLWMGGLATRQDEHVLRRSVFKSGPERMVPQTPHGRRKRGRPRKTWSKHVDGHALQAAGSLDRLHELWAPGPAARFEWLGCVREYCHS